MFALRPVIGGHSGATASAVTRTAVSSFRQAYASSSTLRMLQTARFSSASGSSQAAATSRLAATKRSAPAAQAHTSFFSAFHPSSQARPVVSSVLGLRGLGLGAGSSSLGVAARRMVSTQPGPGGASLTRGASLRDTFSRPENRRSLLINLGLIVGTAAAAHIFFNREKRDSPLDAFSREYLHSTFRYLAGGLTIAGVTALSLHRSGFSYRLMAMNPWVVMGAGLVASIGGMIGAQTFEPGTPAKYASWLLFNAAQGAVLSPLFFFNPALLARAGLYTAGVVGSLCYVGATARDGEYLYLGGPLLAGVTVVALSSIAPLVLPMTAMRTLAITESISLYGGLAVFSGFVLYDTQKILKHADLARRGIVRPDPLRDSIGLELDVINIFIRMVQILAMQGGNNRNK